MDREKLGRRLLIRLQQLSRLNLQNKRKVKKRRFWVREIFRNRDRHGAFATLVKYLRDDRELFFRYIRMSP